MKKYIILVIFISLNVFGFQESKAQCNDTLVKQAIFESGHEAVYLKEYKVKFKKGKANRPARVAKYSAFLKDSTTYRFNVVNAKEYDGKVILQLYRKGKLLGSTFDFKNLKYNKSFDFECKNTDTYQVLMSFIEGKAGCASAILSMVVNDSTIIDDNQFPEILYSGVKNSIYIAYTNEPGCSFQVFSSQGTIEGQNGKYTATPDSTGTLKITAQTIDSLNEVKDEIIKIFKVKKLPIPHVSINGNTGGLISKSDLMNIKELYIHISKVPSVEKYEVLRFKVSDRLIDINGKLSQKGRFSYAQLSFIRNLNTGEQFFITDIKILKPDGEIVTADPLGFIIY